MLLAGCLLEDTPGFGADASTGAGPGSESTATIGTGTSTSGTSATDGGSTTGDIPLPLPIPPRGYVSRPCGFDLDHDGIVAEDGECDLCDGVTEDPDGDGYAQPILYVDCQAGADPLAGEPMACRDPAAPCLTIARAMDEVPTASGLFDEQGLVCFAGTCAESIEVHGGRPMIATRPRSGIEVRDFDYPAQPSMLVGWDRDGDREYPPHDVDDLAVIQPPVDAEGALRFDYGSYNTPTHDVEFAHFTVAIAVADGMAAPPTSFVMGSIGVSTPHERLHFHDLSLQSLRQGHGRTESPVFDLDLRGYSETGEPESSQYVHLAVENVEILDHGGFLFAEHGDMEVDPSGPIRLANLTTRALACSKSDCGDGATTSVMRMAGWMGQVEILASVFDAGTSQWFPYEGTDPVGDPGPTAILVGECAQDVDIVQNEFVGYATAVRVEANGWGIYQGQEASRPCDGRDVDGVRVEGNLVRDSSDRLASSSVAFMLQTAHPDPEVSADRAIGGVRILNNVVVAEHGLLGCAWLQSWGATAGRVELAQHTCLAAIATAVPYPDAALVRVQAPRTGATDPLGDLAVQGLLFAGAAAGNVAIATEYAPAAWVADGNAYAPDAAFRWTGGDPIDLAAWQAAAGQDASSAQCVPTFWAEGDIHLAADDVCAADRAMPLAGVDYDIDGDPRPVTGPWDAGADQRTP